MNSFWIAFSLLLLLALVFLIYPIYINKYLFNTQIRYPFYLPLLVIPFATLLYLYISTWDEVLLIDNNLPPVNEMVVDLESQLADNPDDIVGWQLLGQSYIVMGLYSDAVSALSEAWIRSPSPSLSLKLLYAEAQVLDSPDSITEFPAILFNDVLDDNPLNEKALWYGGLAALRLGDINLASQRWSTLLDIGVPEAVENILVEQIDLLKANSNQDIDELVSADTNSLTLSIEVVFDDSLNHIDIPQDTPLFIFARDKLGGPPIAVIRDEFSSIPSIFYLNDNNLMIPGRSLLDYSELSLTARISLSGNPIATKGDLYGEANFEGDINNVIYIDRIVE